MKIQYKVTANSSSKEMEVPLPTSYADMTDRFSEEAILHHFNANTTVKAQGKIRSHYKLLEAGKTSKLPKGRKEWDEFLTPAVPKTLSEKLLALGLEAKEVELILKGRKGK